MAKQQKKSTLLYFVLGLVVGGLTGFIAGILMFESRGSLLLVTVAGALVFGALGIVFKDRVVEFFPWY